MTNLVKDIKEFGFCKLQCAYSSLDIKSINEKIDEYLKHSHSGIVCEEGTDIVRAIHGPHLKSSYFFDIAKKRMLVEFAQEYLSDLIYIHQFKINMKKALGGEAWPWHQDFIFWREKDYIESPRLLNFAIALDDISILNGPLCVIPGSHKYGNMSTEVESNTSDWEKDVSSSLTYTIKKDLLNSLIEENGFEFLTCKAGDVLAFDPQIAHASASNISPLDRRY